MLEPEYHGNLVSDQGALVTRRWGYDICEYIFRSSGLFTQIIHLDALEWGIRAEFIEVLVTMKPLVENNGSDSVPETTKHPESTTRNPFNWLKKRFKK